MPFLAEHLWQQLVTPHAPDSDSVHLVAWPAHDVTLATEHPVLSQVDAVQRVLALGRAARASSKLKLRQPLREVLVHRRSARGQGTVGLEELFGIWTADVLAELSVKQLRFVDEPEGLWTEGMMPLLPKLGPKYGKQVADIRKAIAAGEVELLDDGRARVGEFTLDADEYEHRSSATDGYALAEDAEWVVAVTTTLDDELVAEGRAREVTRQLQSLRKDAGLDISDRVVVTWAADGALGDAMRTHAGSIADEVLATSFEEGDPSTGDAASFEVDGLAASVQLARA